MLTPEELEPREADLERARDLIAQGYRQTSGSHRLVSKLPPGWTVEDLIKPEALHTKAGHELAELWRRHEGHHVRMFGDAVKLTLREHIAFRRLGGQVA